MNKEMPEQVSAFILTFAHPVLILKEGEKIKKFLWTFATSRCPPPSTL